MKTGLVAIIVLIALSMVSTVQAEESTSSDGWQFKLMPYFWMSSMDADTTVNGLSANANLGFHDVLDYLDFGAMGRVEAWNGKWGLIFDGFFLNLGADESFEGNLGATGFDLDLDIRSGSADFALAYRLVENRFGDNNEKKFTFEPYGGLRYAYLRQKVDVDINIGPIPRGARLGQSEEWVEPFVGSNFRWDLCDKFAISTRGDIGGFGIGSASDLTWQALIMLDYKLSENTSLNVGYRYMDIDYSRGSGTSEFGIDYVAQGPFVGMTILL